MSELVAALKSSILQLEIEIAKAELMATEAHDGEIAVAAVERAERLRRDLESSWNNLRATQAREANGEKTAE